MAVINESIPQRLAQVGEAAEVGEIALPGPGQDREQCMMEVVVLLRVQSVAAGLDRIDDTRVIEVALGDYVRAAPEASGDGVKVFFEFPQDMSRAEIENSMNCVKAQCIDVIFS
jgi:hypothetical protein